MIGWAQAALAEDGYDPPGISKPDVWKAWVAAAVALVAIGVLAFKNAKRTHLD